jgi:photosystem II stability/assembly factor-like uncharacterized protein
MKKLLLASIMCFSICSFGQWTTLNSGTTEVLNTVYFTDENTGYAGGAGATNATLLKTTDGGTTWTNLSINTINEIYSMSFGSDNTGYVLTESNELFKTTDAGTTWNNIINFGGGQGHIKFLNDNIGFAVEGGETIHKTIDGGNTWNNTQLSDFSSPTAIHFPSNQVGYISSYAGKIAKTTDMGATWNIISQPTSKPIRDIHFVTESTGFSVGGDGLSSLIIKTIDGGVNWSVQTTTPATQSAHAAVYFTDENTGYCGNSVIYNTINAGTNWNSMTNSRQIIDLHFPTQDIGYAVGYDGTILKLDNNPLSVENTLLSSKIDIHPNPVSNLLNFNINESISITKIKVFDVTGNLLIEINDNFKSIDMNKYASGIYFVKVMTNDGVLTKKILKN